MNRVATAFLSIALFLPLIQQKACEPKGPQGGAGAPGSSEMDPVAAERAVRQELEKFRVAVESKMARSVMREIDPTRLNAAPAFEDQLTQFFAATSELRLFFRAANVQVRAAEGAGKPASAVAQVDAQMSYSLKSNPAQTLQKSAQLTFELIFTDRGWLYARIEPAGFFAP